MHPHWYLFYTERLKAVLRTCPSNTFVKVRSAPATTHVQCSVLTRETYHHTTPLSAQCILSPKRSSVVHELYATLYRVASSKTPQTTPFENGTRVVVQAVQPAASSALVTLQLHIDPQRPPTQPHTHFDNQRDCLSTAAFVGHTQQHQYQHATPTFVTNPKFAKLPLDQWYPNVPSYPRTMCYDQLVYTAGDWADVWFHAMYSSYTKMRTPTSAVPRSLRPRVKQVMQHIQRRYVHKNTPYTDLSPATTLNTLRYMFGKLQKGVFVRILNNQVETFLPFIRHNFTNDYYHKLHLPNDASKQDHTDLQQLHAYETKLRQWDEQLNHTDPQCFPQSTQRDYQHTLHALLRLEHQCAERYARRFPPHLHRPDDALKKNPNRRQWLANNHFFNTSAYYDLPNVHHFHHVLQQLTAHRKHLPDLEFVLPLRDYPVLRTSRNRTTITLHQPFPNIETPDNAIQMRCSTGLTPILSHTGKDGYDDIPLPTVDDIEYFEQQCFLMKCNGAYLTGPEERPWVRWSDKKIAKAVFRGSATGKGTTPDTNLRLRVKRLANTNKYKHLFDVHLHALNSKMKTEAGRDGLVLLDVKATQQQLGTGKKTYGLDASQRALYKYNLVLDGHTRADRLGNEMCSGSLVILPNTDGHRLWLEPFLCPLDWHTIQTQKRPLTVKQIHAKGYTHITITDAEDLGELVLWLTQHDALAEAIVTNAHQWLFGDATNEGWYSRLTPATNFLYDYMEGVVRALAQQHAHSKRQPYTLVRPVSKKITKTVGIVVGFRDSDDGTRGQQLKAFCKYFDTLFPPSWKRVVVVAEQAVVGADSEAFDKWWDDVVGEAVASITVHDYISHLQRSQAAKTLPPCLVRNLALVHGDCALMCGADRQRVASTTFQRWTKQECYRRTAEEKFNLGLLKNVGFAHLLSTYKSKLSHVVFTDIDMLPDHELAPFYTQAPKPNEIIALATRGTVYDRFTIDDMPHYTLTAAPTRARSNKRHGGHPPHRRHKRSRRHKPRHPHPQSRSHKPHANPRHTYTHKHTPHPSLHPTTSQGKPCVSAWMAGKFQRFLGACVSIPPELFVATNGYPNNFWGWGGEDDELASRLGWVDRRVVYTVPPNGRLMDLEMAQPVTTPDKLASRVKELQKREKRAVSRGTWRDNGVAQVGEVCTWVVRSGSARVHLTVKTNVLR